MPAWVVPVTDEPRVPKPPQFRAREQLEEWFRVQLAHNSTEPAPTVRKRREIELLVARDEALAEFQREQQRREADLDASLTPRSPQPEPLPPEATDDEKAARLYGGTFGLGRGEWRNPYARRAERDYPPTPGEDPYG